MRNYFTFICVLLVSCKMTKTEVALSNDKNILVSVLQIPQTEEAYTLKACKINFNNVDTNGTVHHGFGTNISIKYELEINRDFKKYNLVLEKFVLEKKEAHFGSSYFQFHQGSDTIIVHPSFISTNDTSLIKNEYKGTINFNHFCSTRNNRLVIMFKNNIALINTTWHKT